MTEEISINSLETLTDYVKNIDNTINNVYASQVPEICKKEPCMLGIDEAGRGPVLGPMVYGISYCPLSKTDTLEELKCADSKALNEEKRDDIFSNLVKSDDVGWAVDVISPNIICNNMLGRSKISLNQISMDSAIALVRRAIADGVNLAEIYVDTVGPPEKYQAYLSKLFPEYIITVAKKADSTYPIVSAASICAKVTRDHCLKNWKFIEGLEKTYADFGSGYPGDPVTKNFLVESFDEVFGFPSLVRFSWSTAQNILDDKAFQVDWEDNDQDENSSPVKSLPITSFFKPHSNKPTVKKKHKFFVDCDLENTSEL